MNYRLKNHPDQNNRCHENAEKFRRNIVSSEISSKSPEKPGISSKFVCVTFAQYCNILKKSVFMCGNLDCNKWFIWFETRLAWWPHWLSPIPVARLISTSKTGVHFKLCFLLKLPRNIWNSEFLFPSLWKLETH